jgi:O-6-methylguanine DNA methyltransferase
MKPANASCTCTLPVRTDDGEFVAHYSAKGLCGLDFPSTTSGRRARQAVPAGAKSQFAAWHRLTTAAVKRVLAGQEPGVLPPMDLSCGTEFQQRVWQVLAGIKAGQTLSYGEVAKAIGRPKATRAVGSACGANPVPVLVPCHRVLAAGARLGGFGGGLEWKTRLLEREGVFPNPNPAERGKQGMLSVFAQ